MSSSDHLDADVVDPLADDPLAFLYEPGDEDEENPPELHSGYSSLMGVAVGAGPRKTGKVMAIMLEETEAQRAAEVMEINAGQLMTNPDRSNRQVGFLGLDPLDAGEEEEDDGELAETLNWDAEAEAEEEGADWQPENPLAGTGIVEEEDEDDWQPENPLAGTGIVEDEDGADWQPENPLAGTGFEHTAADDDDWAEPLAPVVSESVSAEPEPEAEQAWSASAPAEQPRFEEVEWDAPLAAAEPAEEPVAEAVAAADEPYEAVAIDVPDEVAAPAFEQAEIAPEIIGTDEIADRSAPIDWQPLPESDIPLKRTPSAPIAWESLLAKRPPKKQVDLTPIDWHEFAEDQAPAEHAQIEPASFEPAQPEPTQAEPIPPVDDGWPDTGEEPFELPAEPAIPDWQAFAAEEEVEEAEAIEEIEEIDAVSEIAPPAEAEWQGFTAEQPTGLYETEWQGFAAEQPAGPDETEWRGFTAEQPAGPYETEWSVLAPHAPDDYSAEQETPPEPTPIEIVRLPAPPVVAVPRHSIRARVMQSQPPRKQPVSRIKPVLQWLAARFKQVVWPLLKQLWAWSKAKWAEIAARAPRD